MDLVANSTPIVDLESRLNSLRVNRLNRLDLPTPESPIRTTKSHVSGGLQALPRAVGSGELRTFKEKLGVIVSRRRYQARCATYIIFIVRHACDNLDREREESEKGCG